MRTFLSAGLLAAVLLAPLAAQAEVSDEGAYVGSAGAGVAPYWTGASLIFCPFADVDPNAGCVGGDTLYAPDGQEYGEVEVSATDSLTGPNVQVWGCFAPVDPSNVTRCEGDGADKGSACGTSLVLELVSQGKASSRVELLIRTVAADVTTNEVCVGTAGDLHGFFRN